MRVAAPPSPIQRWRKFEDSPLQYVPGNLDVFPRFAALTGGTTDVRLLSGAAGWDACIVSHDHHDLACATSAATYPGGIVALDVQDGHSCALTQDGKVMCWGSNGGRRHLGTTSDTISFTMGGPITRSPAAAG